MYQYLQHILLGLGALHDAIHIMHMEKYYYHLTKSPHLWGIGKYVSNQLHGELRRVDVGIADHELLQYVVLNGSLQLVLTCTLHPYRLPMRHTRHLLRVNFGKVSLSAFTEYCLWTLYWLVKPFTYSESRWVLRQCVVYFTQAI